MREQNIDIAGGCVSLGTLYHAGEWANEACTATNSFICQGARSGISTTTPSKEGGGGAGPSGVSASCTTGWVDSGDGKMCFQVIKMCFQVVKMCFQVIKMCFQVVKMCFQVITMCFQVIKMCFQVITMCFQVIKMCFR